jgi:peptidylprolyl isomerase
MKRSVFTGALLAFAPIAAFAAKMPKVMTLPGGLTYVDLKVGKGPMPKTGQNVTVNYVGTLTNGTVFDASSRTPEGTFTFAIGEKHVIEGWDEGVATMRVGGKRKLTIPPSLGYGAQGAGTVIPPNATLIFVIDLISIS